MSMRTIKPGKKIDTTPFDRRREPPRQNLFLTPLIWLLCFFQTRAGRLRIVRRGMKGLRPPFLVLATHHAFMDFYVTPLALFPFRANYISELEGFESFGENLYRNIGCLGTRKFVHDMALIRNIRRVTSRGDIIVIYPEARYANAGTSSQLEPSVVKLARLLDVPIVTLNMHGNYLHSPIWNLRKRRGVRLFAECELAFSREALRETPDEAVYKRLSELLSYNEYAWQVNHGIRIDAPFRAEGLEAVLYKCRHCSVESQMTSSGATLSCKSCGAAWEMTPLGELTSVSVPDRDRPAADRAEGTDSTVCIRRDDAPRTAEVRSDIGDVSRTEELHLGAGGNGKTESIGGEDVSLIKELRTGAEDTPLAEKTHIPDWYEWEREAVVSEVKSGKYLLDCPVEIEALPNAKNFIALGQGRLRHDREGFTLTFRNYGDTEARDMKFAAKAMPSVHTEYDYRGKGQCIVLSTPDNSYFIYPLRSSAPIPTTEIENQNWWNVTKIQFAQEALYR